MTDIAGWSAPFSENFQSQETRISFTLQYWCLWQSKQIVSGNFWPNGEVLPWNGGNADVSFLPMMQSRRLSPLARAVSAVAWHSRQQCGEMPALYFSRHGESQYYFEMLQGMAAGEELSPSRFSLSVHNAIAGLCSFQSGSTLPYVCLAGGTEGLFAAFLEAGGLLSESPRVRVIFYEQALPLAYRDYIVASETTYALCMVLSRAGGSGNQLRFARRAIEGESNSEEGSENLVQALLAGQRSAVCQLKHSTWAWSLDDV